MLEIILRAFRKRHEKDICLYRIEQEKSNQKSKGENMLKIIKSKGRSVLVNCDNLTSVEVSSEVFWEGDVKNLLQWSSVKIKLYFGDKEMKFDLDMIFKPNSTAKMLNGSHQLLPNFEKNVENKLLEAFRDVLRDDTVISINLNSMLDSILDTQVVSINSDEMAKAVFDYEI